MNVDDLYRVIEKQCCKGYRLADNCYGLPYIEKKHIKEESQGVFVVRFRLERDVSRLAVESVANDVMTELGCSMNAFLNECAEAYEINDKKFYGWYIDCCWVLSFD